MERLMDGRRRAASIEGDRPGAPRGWAARFTGGLAWRGLLLLVFSVGGGPAGCLCLASGEGFTCNFTGPPCGDGVLDPDAGEQCDEGSWNSDTEPDRCRWDCRLPWCGDGVQDSDEQCDPLAPVTERCADRGYTDGPLSCTASCTLDESLCATCGNGVVETPTEECDGPLLLGTTCEQLGYPGGELACDMDCQLDHRGCFYCGNQRVDPGEECDGLDLAGASCATLGFSGGSLGCAADCTVDLGACFTCGNGICDGTAGEGAAACPADCGWQAVAAGDEHSCGLRRDGSVYCWGGDRYGQLGLGWGVTLEPCGADRCSLVPRRVALGPARSLSAGAAHTCAALETGEVYCWGENDRLQIYASGALFREPEPVDVGPVVDIVQVAAGGRFTCALSAGGEVICWGDNQLGQLGREPMSYPGYPRAVAGLGRAVAVTAGSAHACALIDDGDVYCWGGNDQLQVGAAGPWYCGFTSCFWAPVRVPGVSAVVSLTAGARHTCARSAQGDGWCWGANDLGQLGSGGDAFAGPTPWIAAGALDGLFAAGEASCEVVDGTALACVGVPAVGPFVAPADATPIAVDAGQWHGVLLTADGTVLSWGQNGFGQLGNGTFAPASAPAPLADP